MKTMIYILIIMSMTVPAQTPSAELILKKVDENIVAENRITEAEMVIHGRRGDRTIRSKSWIKGAEESFTEYLAPAREKGTKMLKQGDNLWTYSPNTDRTILIAGHMLRQSVMGSDLSYEDLMEDPKLQNLYKATIIGEENYLNRNCWILELKAKDVDVAYFTRKIWVDRERFLIMKESRYAKSGKLLKNTEVKSVIKIEERWVPEKMVFKDMLKVGEGTEFLVINIKFNADIPDYIFSKAALKK